MTRPLRMLVLSKRRYMSRDLLDDRYGRFRELPLALARRGHQVEGICLSYQGADEGMREDRDDGATVRWHALNARRLWPIGGRGYRATLDRIAATLRPDVIWACSDAPHAVLGVLAARRTGARLVIDLYDNFDSYPLARVPGVSQALRWAVRRADAVTCISAPLRDYVGDVYGRTDARHVLENGVPTGTFHPRDRQRCRERFGLPHDARVIGTAGALTASRGIDMLYRAFERLAAERDDVHLAVAGPRDAQLPPPAGPRVHDFGLLAADAVPELLGALDVSVVCNRDTAFGRYCFPQKLYESVACGIPVAVANVGAMREVLRDFPQSRFDPEDDAGLEACLRGLLADPAPLPLRAPTWSDLAARLEAILRT